MTSDLNMFFLAVANKFGGMTKAEIKALEASAIMIAHAIGAGSLVAAQVMAELDKQARERLDEGDE